MVTVKTRFRRKPCRRVALGFAYAGARLYIGSIWSLAVLHGLSNFCQDRVSGEVPEVMYVIATALLFTYGAILVRGAQQPLAGARGQ